MSSKPLGHNSYFTSFTLIGSNPPYLQHHTKTSSNTIVIQTDASEAGSQEQEELILQDGAASVFDNINCRTCKFVFNFGGPKLSNLSSAIPKVCNTCEMCKTQMCLLTTLKQLLFVLPVTAECREPVMDQVTGNLQLDE